jgi:hypothetical protein
MRRTDRQQCATFSYRSAEQPCPIPSATRYSALRVRWRLGPTGPRFDSTYARAGKCAEPSWSACGSVRGDVWDVADALPRALLLPVCARRRERIPGTLPLLCDPYCGVAFAIAAKFRTGMLTSRGLMPPSSRGRRLRSAPDNQLTATALNTTLTTKVMDGSLPGWTLANARTAKTLCKRTGWTMQDSAVSNLKTGGGESRSWVRIPPPPPASLQVSGILSSVA